MDFAFTQAMDDVAGLARKIFAEHPEDGWRFLDEAGLLEPGGLLETCALLEEQGRAAAPAPLWQTLIGALASPGALAALVDEGVAPALAGDRVTGVVMAVPARAPLVVATDGGLVRVEPDAAGVTFAPQLLTTGEQAYQVTLERAAAARLAVDAGWLLRRATIALCALELGLCERALAMTAAYTSQRRQFDRPIATFQAVAQRAADAYIDVEVIRLTLWQAAWLLASGRDDEAAAPVAVAKYWAAEAGHRVVYAAQHLHGGIGFDASYPLGRGYLWSRQIELTLGGAARQLALLGADLAKGF